MSLALRTVNTLVRAMKKPAPDSDDDAVQIEAVKSLPGLYGPPKAGLRRIANVETITVAGQTVYHLTPKGHRTGTQMIFWHGGAWVLPLAQTQWGLIKTLIKKSGAEMWVPEYALAPRKTIDDSLQLMDDLTDLVVARAGRGRLIIAGDSAGGNLATTQALRMRERGTRPPDQLLLFSPCIDVSFSNPESYLVQTKDIALNVKSVQACGRAWAGKRSVKDPLISAMYADLTGMPPMAIYQGTDDIMTPDNRIFVEKARAAGVKVDYIERPDAPHTYILLQFTPEARQDIIHATNLIKGPATRIGDI